MPGTRSGGGYGSGAKSTIARVRQAVTKKTKDKKQQKKALKSPTAPRPKVVEQKVKKEAAKLKKETRKADVAEKKALRGEAPAYIPKEMERRECRERQAGRAEKEDRFV